MPRFKVQTRLIAIFLFLTQCLVCGLFFDSTNRIFFEKLRGQLKVNASLIAVGIDGDLHERLKSESSSDYKKLKDYLIVRRKLSDGVRDVYTMRPEKKGSWQFVVDAESPDSEVFAKLGENFDSLQDRELPKGIDGPAASTELVRDKWGTWISGFAPIKRSDGKAVGILGIDMSAAQYLQERLFLAQISLGLFLLGLLAYAVVGYWFSRRIAQPIEEEEKHQEAVQQDLRLSNEHSLELLKWARENIDDLQLAHDQAIQLAKLKSEFLSTMSHEIRTPMHAILGMIDLLLDTPLDEKQRKFAVLVQGAGKDLLTLIDDILDTTKLEEGKLLIEQIDFSPRALVESVVELLKPKANEKGLALQALIDPATPFALRGDPHRLRQILFNFVGNALKFTERGQVTVEVVSEGQKLIFTVRDTGIGISESDRRRLLQPFTQADGSTARKYGGTGLGLFISNQLIGLMGGTLEIASSEGQGSAFRFSVLFEPAEALPELSPLTPLRLAEEGAPVLLVEDNLVNQKIALLLLEKLGLSAHVAENGRQAIEMIGVNSYRLVLMDCHLPVMDGFQTTALIRSKEDSSHQRLPIIALTANTLEADRERCLAAGMDGFLGKPFDLRQLQGVLKDWLNWKEESPKQEASLIPLRLSELQEVCRGDEAVLFDLLKFFLSTTAELVADLKSAFEKKDFASLSEHAHTLKGACASMTAGEMASLSKEIEQEAKSDRDDLLPESMRKLEVSFERVRVFLEEVLPHVGE